MKNADKIEHFFATIDEARQEAEAAKPFCARLVLLALLDALSRTAYPALGNRSRFVKFVDEFTQWELASFYSLVQLHMLLSEPNAPTSTPGFQALFDHVQKKLHLFPIPGEIVFSRNVDLPLEQLQTFLSPKLNKHIECTRFPQLLWSLRNSVVHELRNTGLAFDFELRQASPYYYNFIHADGYTRTWELYFPTELLTCLVTSGMENLKPVFQKNDEDPWKLFPYEPRWYKRHQVSLEKTRE